MSNDKDQSVNSLNFFSGISNSSSRDRTAEFMLVAKTLQNKQNKDGMNSRSQSRHANPSEFSIVAKRIGNDIANTFKKLEKLANLAKKMSLFDDKPLEIQQLTNIIKQDINDLNRQIAQLREIARLKNMHNGRHIQTHSNSVLYSLQSRLASMSKDFKGVLEIRTANLKQQKERREQFSTAPVPMYTPTDNNEQSVLLRRNNSSVSINMDSLDSPHHQMQLIDQQDNYIQDRAETMENIESTIVELGGIFQQLATMVKEQEEQVLRIDANVEDTQANVEAAHSEILKYFQSISSNRWLMIKIFGVLMIFFIIFVVFMV
ncbi:uncharacterized protein TRIADDRAFT_19936 [Trichoplax adhaerens]|uniref:t-SNARE coiled-coil homology domain-containing protein n=1 Tax=Trichoplax adhaerens TaxID=10228 RepID=B3RJT6_TRIAD|nr:hypothetical protein TRIADDRAFT_19936 [Trichoplax adhaerens]EDV29841.1 hypothetical protein TRIADDRAFT_19936 [Trichoplax adhaerens]|eukprot:XP_002109043.1 hypothetical protein TRIADDRAFT_19936 [Trichoplax adhaerens]